MTLGQEVCQSLPAAQQGRAGFVINDPRTTEDGSTLNPPLASENFTPTNGPAVECTVGLMDQCGEDDDDLEYSLVTFAIEEVSKV